ncbi:uncharacterized protein [Asterias amurensis]|uniref:uncharacterized protein n=1 Tax=Asterias amurensis TaxID=7602 RepID=UPI003AB428B2
MKTDGHPPLTWTILLVVVCCMEIASGSPSNRKKKETRDSELHHDQRMTVDEILEGLSASGGISLDTGDLNPKKLHSLTERLALLESARHKGNGIKKHPKNVRSKRDADGGLDPASLFGDGGDYSLVNTVLFEDWSECNVSCGIGFKTLNRHCEDPSACESNEPEWQRCLGIDCKSRNYLEAKLACRGGSSSPIIGIVIGITITLVTGGVVVFIQRFAFGKDSSKTEKSEKSSSRPPKTPPRHDKAKDDEDEHIYEEVDGSSKEKKKEKSKKEKKEKKKKEKKGKSKKKADDRDDSDDGYVDPDELNQPGSEDLEIHRLRDPPSPPAGRKSKKSQKKQKEENAYEIPMENDYIEIDE